jgi:N-carbamoylputrescine amidase
MSAPFKMTNTTKIALIQMRCGPKPDENLTHAIELIRGAAAKGAQVVCLPELFRSQYFCQTEDHKNFDLAEEIPGASTSTLGDVARQTGAVIIASLFEKRSAGLYHNTAAIIDADGKLLGKYRKMHIPDDPLYHEKFYFTPGDLGFQAWPTTRGKIGVCVCWDQWYPEAARLTALHGAEIIFYPTAIGWHPSEKKDFGKAQHSAWETIQRGHAIANGCYVAVANRVGHETPAGGYGI